MILIDAQGLGARRPNRPLFTDLSLTLNDGDRIGVVGLNGSGKSTLLSMMSGDREPETGIVRRGRNARVGALPQLPLLPPGTVRTAVCDGLDRDAWQGEAMLSRLGMGGVLDTPTDQLSGGQKARVGIARAMALHPKLVILDEPTAALDVSVQAVVLNLLQDLKQSMGTSYLFVSHDLNVVRLLCDRVIVMQTGRIVEQGPSEQVLGDPQDAYTKELLTAIPHPPLPA